MDAPSHSDPYARANERSRAMWDEMAPAWYARRNELWELSQPVTDWMIRKIDPQPGNILLELAAGLGETGFMAAALTGENGRLICSDFAPGMVEAARERAQAMGITNVEFRVLDAQQIELDTGSVDAVLCRWGYMLMADIESALTETRRVLRAGGRLAFSVFSAPEQNPGVSLITEVLVEKACITCPDMDAQGFFSLSEPQRIRQLLIGAGFVHIEIEKMALLWRFADWYAYWNFLLEAAGPVSPMLRLLDTDQQEEVQQALQELTQPFKAGSGYNFPVTVLNVAAR